MSLEGRVGTEGVSTTVETGDGMEGRDVGFFGNDLEEKGGNLRIMYNNVDGLKIGDFIKMKISDKIQKEKCPMLKEKRGVEKVTGILATLRSWDANILCLAETQTAWDNYICRMNVGNELRKIDGHAGFIGSSSSAVCCSVYKPGGTLTVYDGNWASRISKGVDKHKLGRWSYITIEGRNTSILTIITAYRCCRGQTSRTTGLSGSYSQQESILRARGIKKTPQTAFIDDIESFINKKVQLGHEIMLNIDANEEWDSPTSEIRQLAQRLDLYDIAKELHPEGVPATYSRVNVSRRIDFMLCSHQVLQNVSAYGMAPDLYGKMLGDHRAQYVDLNVNQLLHLTKYDTGSPMSRKLQSKDPKCVKSYCEKVKKTLRHTKYLSVWRNCGRIQRTIWF